MVQEGYVSAMPDRDSEGSRLDPSIFQVTDRHVLVMGCKGYSVSIATIYLDNGIGLTGPNIGKIVSLVKALKVLGKPYIIIGDFNIQPTEAIQAGLEYYTDARIVVPANTSGLPVLE